MATTKKKKAAPGKGKSKAKKAAKPAKSGKTAKAKTTAKPKKAARPKAAKSAARRPAGGAKRSATKTTARPKPARAKARRATRVSPPKPAAGMAAGMDGEGHGNLASVADESPGLAEEARSTTTLLQTVDLGAPPDEVYRAYMMPARHAEFTGGAAEIDARVGGSMSAWNGYIMGEFLQLEEGRRIVQTWRTTEWPEGYGDSKLELTFTPTESGTRVTMVHSNVPSQQAHRYEDGWKNHYWEPLKKYLSWETPTVV